MLWLLISGALSEMIQPGIIRNAFSRLNTRADRTYKESTNTFLGQLMLSVFRIGTLGMALYFSVYTGGTFSIVTFFAICGLILVMWSLIWLINGLLGYTFSLRLRGDAAREHYSNMVTLATIILYPTTLIMMHVGSAIATLVTVSLVIIGFIALWLYRTWGLLVSSFAGALYMMMYIVTLEVLPFTLLYYLSAKIANIL